MLARPLAQPFDDPREAIRVDRLQEVVERLDRERIDRVLRVRGHEDDCRRIGSLAHERRRREAGDAGHLDVEEDDVDLGIARQREAVGRSAQPRPSTETSSCAAEQIAQLAACGCLVVDDHCADHAGTSSRTTVPNGNERRRTPSP